MLAARDYYAVLGVTPTSEDVVIQAAYKALMRKYHPDANHDAGMSKWAADFSEAFAVIGRADRRAAYDAQRWESQRGGAADRRSGDAAPPQRDDAPDFPPQGFGSAPQWKSWAKKGAGILIGVAAAKLLTLLAASLDVSSPPLAYRPSDLVPAPFAAAEKAAPVSGRPVETRQLQAKTVLSLRGAPAVAKADMVRAARRIEHVFGRGGVSASIDVSRECHTRALSGGDWSSFDFCTAFDDAARTADLESSRASGVSPSAYFFGVASPASQIATYAPLSRDGAALGRRLRDIRRGVARHTGASLPSASIKRAKPAMED